MLKKRHIGDGVYAEFDGYHVTLTAESNGQTNAIYLDWRTREALVVFIDEADNPLVEVEDAAEDFTVTLSPDGQ